MDLINPVIEQEEDQNVEAGQNNQIQNNNVVLEEVSDYVIESLEEWAEIMNHELKVQDHYVNWFTNYNNCYLGGQIFDWLMDRAAPESRRAR